MCLHMIAGSLFVKEYVLNCCILYIGTEDSVYLVSAASVCGAAVSLWRTHAVRCSAVGLVPPAPCSLVGFVWLELCDPLPGWNPITECEGFRAILRRKRWRRGAEARDVAEVSAAINLSGCLRAPGVGCHVLPLSHHRLAKCSWREFGR